MLRGHPALFGAGSTANKWSQESVSKCLLLLEVGFAEKFSSTKYNAKCMTYNFIQVLGRYILKRKKGKQVHTSYVGGTTKSLHTFDVFVLFF